MKNFSQPLWKSKAFQTDTQRALAEVMDDRGGSIAKSPAAVDNAGKKTRRGIFGRRRKELSQMDYIERAEVGTHYSQHSPHGYPSHGSHNAALEHEEPPQLHLKVKRKQSHDTTETFRCTESHRDNMTDASYLKDIPSHSTLRSFYDSHNVPSAVSQQTSDSSARDLALRKGLRPIMSQNQSPSTSSTLSKANSPGTVRKARPTRLDLSALFPTPQRKDEQMLSPQRYTDSPTPLTAKSETLVVQSYSTDDAFHQPETFRVPSQSQSMSKSNKKIAQLLGEPAYLKMNVRRPKHVSGHWFDVLDEDTSNEEPELQPDFLHGMTSALDQDALPATQSIQRTKSRNVMSINMPNISEESQPTQAGQDLSHTLQLPVHSCSDVQHALNTWEHNNHETKSLTVKKTTARSKNSSNTAFEHVDLQEQSVLYLTSSDDEDDSLGLDPPDVPSEEEDYSELKKLRKLPLIRDSVGIDSISDIETGVGTERMIHRANLAQMPTTEELIVSRRPKAANESNKFVIEPTSVDIPVRKSSKTRTNPSDRTFQRSLSRERDTIPESFAKTHADEEAGMSSADIVSLDRSHSTRTMHVTRQERSLLAAMRIQKS